MPHRQSSSRIRGSGAPAMRSGTRDIPAGPSALRPGERASFSSSATLTSQPPWKLGVARWPSYSQWKVSWEICTIFRLGTYQSSVDNPPVLSLSPVNGRTPRIFKRVDSQAEGASVPPWAEVSCPPPPITVSGLWHEWENILLDHWYFKVLCHSSWCTLTNGAHIYSGPLLLYW